jgi:hypothetical protein
MRQYCYKNDCSFVKTGFRIEQYDVCSVCKLEVAESLIKRKTEEQEAEKRRKEREEARNKDDEDEQKDLWTFL